VTAGSCTLQVGASMGVVVLERSISALEHGGIGPGDPPARRDGEVDQGTDAPAKDILH
jgi:hypothetical protein